MMAFVKFFVIGVLHILVTFEIVNSKEEQHVSNGDSSTMGLVPWDDEDDESILTKNYESSTSPTSWKGDIATEKFIEDKECKCEKNISLTLSDVGLTNIPDNFIISDDVRYLYLNNNSINSISENAFVKLPNLVYLDLSGISTSPKSIPNLKGLDKLKTLVLRKTLCRSEQRRNSYYHHYSYNSQNEYVLIKYCDNNLLKSCCILPGLETLHLEENCITNLNDLITYSPKLTTLYLSKNKIDLNLDLKLPDTVTHLYLDGNSISKVFLCNNVFKNIEYLVLDNNEINLLSCGEHTGYKNMTKLRYLSVRHNRISELDSIAFMYNLVHLDMSYNEIRNFSEDLFSDTPFIKDLCISGNGLTSIPKFHNMTNLKYLNVDDNKIETIDPESFSGMQSLKILSLRNNGIKNIQENTFKYMSNLESLDLSNNHLQFLPSNWYSNLANLRSLFVESNKFSNILDLNIRGAMSLANLYLNGNQIEKISVWDILRLPKNVTLYNITK